jgi:hypothetical protein
MTLTKPKKNHVVACMIFAISFVIMLICFFPWIFSFFVVDAFSFNGFVSSILEKIFGSAITGYSFMFIVDIVVSLIVIISVWFVYHKTKNTKKFWIWYFVCFGVFLIISFLIIKSIPWGTI